MGGGLHGGVAASLGCLCDLKLFVVMRSARTFRPDLREAPRLCGASAATGTIDAGGARLKGTPRGRRGDKGRREIVDLIKNVIAKDQNIHG